MCWKSWCTRKKGSHIYLYAYIEKASFSLLFYILFLFSCVCVCVCNNTIVWNHFQIKYKRLCVVHIYTKQSQMYLHDVRFEQKLSWKCVYTLFVCYIRWLKYSMFLFAYAVVSIENIILKKGKSINYVCVCVSACIQEVSHSKILYLYHQQSSAS